MLWLLKKPPSDKQILELIAEYINTEKSIKLPTKL